MSNFLLRYASRKMFTFIKAQLLIAFKFEGVYATLIPFSSYLLLFVVYFNFVAIVTDYYASSKRDSRSTVTMLLFCMTIFMFLLSSFFWAVTTAYFLIYMNINFISSDPEQQSIIYTIFPMANALALINVNSGFILCSNQLSPNSSTFSLH